MTWKWNLCKKSPSSPPLPRGLTEQQGVNWSSRCTCGCSRGGPSIFSRRKWTLLSVTGWHELGDMLGLFQTAEDGQARFLLGPCHWEPVPENAIVRISKSAK